MKTVKLFTLIAFITLSCSVFGQQYLIAHGGISLPFSDYGDVNVNNDMATGANIGINADIFYTYPLSSYGLGLYTEAGVNFNGLKKDYKGQMDNYYSLGGLLDLSSADITYSKYLSFPFSVGANYTHFIDRDLSVYGHIGIAGNILKITKAKIKTNDNTYPTNYDMSFGSGIKIGFGVIYKDNITLTLNMFTLGAHKVQGEFDLGIIDGAAPINEVNVSYFAVTVGKKF